MGRVEYLTVDDDYEDDYDDYEDDYEDDDEDDDEDDNDDNDDYDNDGWYHGGPQNVVGGGEPLHGHCVKLVVGKLRASYERKVGIF